MIIRVPSYYNKFNCIAADCEDTCCAGWDVVIDDKTKASYRTMDGPLGDTIRDKMVVDDDGDTIFVLDHDRCPFLNRDNLCDIHKEKGEAYLCRTCKLFPRYMEDYMNIREMGISLSCEEAARIILGTEKSIEFERIHRNKDVDSKAHGHEEDFKEEDFKDEDFKDDVDIISEDKDEEEILEEFFRCRDLILDIIYRDDLPLGLSASISLKLVEALQDNIDFDELDQLPPVREAFSDKEILQKCVREVTTHETDEDRFYEDGYAYVKTFINLEHISDTDPLGLSKLEHTFWGNEGNKELYIQKHKAFNLYYKDRMVEFDKLLIYFIYRYFMKSFHDYDMSSKIKVALMSTIMIKELAVVRWIEKGSLGEEDMVDISHMYSKDIEHLIQNIETLERIFETEEVYRVDRLIHRLMVTF